MLWPFTLGSGAPDHNTYLTFSERPQLVDLDPGKTLRDKLQIALSHAEVANTNVEAAFQLILDTAVKHHLSQEELPQTLLILSDMEFDRCGIPCHPAVVRCSARAV